MGDLQGELEYAVFTRDVDGLRVIVMASIFPAEYRGRYPHLATFSIPFQAREDGLPAGNELSRVGKLEDNLAKALEGDGAVHLGHTLGGGVLRAYFAMHNSNAAKVKVKSGLLSKIELMPDCRQDPDWLVYRHHLEPSWQELENQRNEQLLTVLAENGDDHSKPRLVDFGLNFGNAAQRSAFLEQASAQGFHLSPQGCWESDGRFWCEIQKETAIETEIIGAATRDLRSLASEHGGELDGWACSVER